MTVRSVEVVCTNRGTNDKTVVIDGTAYVLDNYDLSNLIEALTAIRDITYCQVQRWLVIQEDEKPKKLNRV